MSTRLYCKRLINDISVNLFPFQTTRTMPRLPLVIGIAADRALTAEAAQRAEEPVAKILADMRSLYRATPFLLLVQLPAMLRGFADRLAETFEADIVDLEDHFARFWSSGVGANDEPWQRPA